MEVVALVSGGKDSCFAMMRCLDYGHKARLRSSFYPSPHLLRVLSNEPLFNFAVARRLLLWLILSP